MKTELKSLACRCVLLISLLASAVPEVLFGADILAGPVTNSANGHGYFLLSQSSWTEAEAKAVELGGHLVTINDAAENDWVLSTFGGGGTRALWIGLTDAAAEGTFVWISGDTATYRNWGSGEPNNYGGDEDYAYIGYPALGFESWDDLSDSGYNPASGVDLRSVIHGVVEIDPATPPPPGVQIVTGPITNSANGHVYYLLSQSSWTEAEAKAVELGGHLVTVNDAAENDWVLSTFGGGGTKALWTGLTDAAAEGTFTWVSGDASTYRNWASGEPNNFGGNEHYAYIGYPALTDGTWNDSPDSGYNPVSGADLRAFIHGVVEISTANLPPVADASATAKLLVSPNGVNVVAVLDGSQSSDPDGDALTYAWFIAGEPDALATGAVAVTALPVGANHLTLVVSDGLAEGSQSFTVEVITTAQAVGGLAALVAQAPKPKPLLATLRAVLAAIDRNQPATAINQLQAFQHKVKAQVAPHDPELAVQLMVEAQAIIDALNGSGAPGLGQP